MALGDDLRSQFGPRPGSDYPRTATDVALRVGSFLEKRITEQAMEMQETRQLVNTLLTHNAALQREVDTLKATYANQQGEIVRLQREVKALWVQDGTLF